MYDDLDFDDYSSFQKVPKTKPKNAHPERKRQKTYKPRRKTNSNNDRKYEE